MSPKTRRKLNIALQYSVGWSLAFSFLTIIRSIGTIETGTVNPNLTVSLIISLILGLSFGAISGLVQYWIEERVYKRVPIGQLILFKAIYIIFFILSMIVAAYFILPYFMEVKLGFIDFAIDDGSAPIYFYILVIDILMSVFRQINLMLGEGNLWKVFTGSFYTPKEEKRIFMFLDLQSSTELAEKLGHIRYSQFIQDCFLDLGIVMQQYASIYQYVGDEAILTWTLKKGLENQNCLKAFFAFKARLHKRKSYYLGKYNHQPFFKAGINAGTITATEVGKYKREIAYHGDAINTAARIQTKCNEYGAELLISESLQKLIETNDYRFEPIGKMPLKGKAEEMLLFEVKILDSAKSEVKKLVH